MCTLSTSVLKHWRALMDKDKKNGMLCCVGGDLLTASFFVCGAGSIKHAYNSEARNR